MFISMPVQISMAYGMPIHTLMQMIVIRAQLAFVQNGSGVLIQPHFSR